MVRYVVLRRFLQEIPSRISFRDPRVSAWLTPKGGHLRGVATPALADWGAGLLPKNLFDGVPAATETDDEDYGDSSDEEMDDWPEDDDDGDYSREDPPPSATLAVDTRLDAGHITMGTASPRDTCPHTCIIFNQNVNGLGGRRDDKLEKLIAMMIEQRIHAYCVQETWQLQDYMLTIRGHTIFHHGMKDKP